jgi:Fe-S-cluster-containing hydrogenase component 2
MTNEDIFERLAQHFSQMAMALPFSEEMVEILKENLTPLEAEVALALPNRVVPLDFVDMESISPVAGLSEKEMLEVMESLTSKGIVLSGKTRDGKRGYALWQSGFGFTQVFYWKGEETPHARKMTELIRKYFKKPEVFKEGRTFRNTKPYRYIPVGETIEPAKQGVFSQHMMEKVVNDAEAIAVAHCPCRMRRSLMGEGCGHSIEVCLKFNDLARYVIEKGYAREVTKREALEIIKKSEEEGLVHFVDNAEGNVQHNCNCCGCSCWNVGPIKRRKVPRDSIMATYFLRATDEDVCVGCGECVEICPVDAIELEDDAPAVDEEWCIGCGVCATRCPSDAITMKLRTDRTGELPAEDFKSLHEIILKERTSE